MGPRLIPCLALALTAGGCSLIDDFGSFSFAADAGADGATDGAADSSPADTGADTGDATPDGGVDADANPDAPLPGRTCTDPCLGDAFLDFSPTLQEVATLDWAYLKDPRDAVGIGHEALVPGVLGTAPAWVDAEGDVPAIIYCERDSAIADCAGVVDMLVLRGEAHDAVAGGDPVLAFSAPTTSTYRIRGSHQSPEGVVGKNMELVVSRNGRPDLVETLSFLPTREETEFSLEFEAAAGDRILLLLRAGPAVEGDPPPVALHAAVYPGDEPALADCQLMATFNDPDPLTEECVGHQLRNEPWLSDGTVTEETESATESLGKARRFLPDQYIFTNALTMDYSGDFTVQMWLQVNESDELDIAVYSDEGAEARGVTLYFDREDTGSAPIFLGFSYPDASCELGECFRARDFNPRPTDGGWHFYRIVRSAAAGEIELCIDGVRVLRDDVPASADLSPGRTLHIGRARGSSPRLDGAIDDVRVTTTAAPCAL